MDPKDLQRANYLNSEINKLESFIYTASKVWTGKIIKQESRYIFKSSPYGFINSEEYFMDTAIKNKVLDVLKNHLERLKEELKQL